MHSPQVNPKVKYGFWVIMICQWRFICGKQCTILVGNVDNGEGYACVGAGNIWKISLPPSQFCCTPKIAHKKIVLKKKLYLFFIKIC